MKGYPTADLTPSSLVHYVYLQLLSFSSRPISKNCIERRTSAYLRIRAFYPR